MMDRIEEETVRYLFFLQPVVETEPIQQREQPLYYQRPQSGANPVRMKQARSMIPKKRKKKKRR